VGQCSLAPPSNHVTPFTIPIADKSIKYSHPLLSLTVATSHLLYSLNLVTTLRLASTSSPESFPFNPSIMSFQINATIASFGGKLLKLTHQVLQPPFLLPLPVPHLPFRLPSPGPATLTNLIAKAKSTSCEMKLNLYLPHSATPSTPAPMLFYLAGLTCTGDNGAEKGFLQPTASQKGIAVVYPDTSPRGLGIKGEDESYDFGSGAGFYVDATKEPWKHGYRMYSYITEELPAALCQQFKELDGGRMSLTGHSMGGHGALTLFLKNPGKYRSVSAFAPICNPSQCPWGKKAFEGYFGEESKARWAEYDATELLKNFPGETDILIDVGTGDGFYKEGQLLPENLEKVAKGKGKGVRVRYQDGYDHSYFFISTFAGEHVEHAAKYLLA